MEIESLQEALRDFEKKTKGETCPILEQFLCHVAKTGETMVQWSQFKNYFLFKLEKVMDDFRASAPEQRGPANPNVESIPFEDMKERILKIVEGYNGIPFTIQRLCELLTEPKRNYTGTDKFLRGVEKNVMVVSCVHPTSEKNGCSTVNRMNGVMLSGSTSSFTERKVNGPGTPRPLNRPKLSLANSLAANGLPDSTESKDLKTDQESVKDVSGSEVSASGESLGSSVKNKHSDTEEDVEPEREVKRLKFGEEEDDEEEEEEEEEDEEEEQEVEMPQPLYGTCVSKEAEAMVHEEEKKVHLKEDASFSAIAVEDQEPTSSTQAETCPDEELAERDKLCRSQNDASDVDQEKQVSPACVARSPETNADSEEFHSDPVSSSSSSSSSNSSSCSIDESVEVAPEDNSPTPSSSTNEPSSEGGMENVSVENGTADKPLEQD
ncbi:serine/threonine-protein phosphatase 4 regulatory subunit 2-B [Corythoichthys intestinalis]|uniref:serine/threonine-protein phosphatase 4 regulatory subunit 2-B n=1 Tax=Corythoichthys intestinalis TaxID=161448 RepID=UPI0025A64CF2|nr:serine/threonine-protein phosphatase 4 regulatory subunit 2-B [Corythoichthys intestinalis]XP_061814380.1 serine/threonine-protein phosphatase 4 regulatory subunit 2-B-like [Nerophis lumbriciformis]